jgi:hypothetical protein
MFRERLHGFSKFRSRTSIRARPTRHTFKRHGMMEGLDETLCHHLWATPADSPRGVFAHTGSGVVGPADQRPFARAA